MESPRRLLASVVTLPWLVGLIIAGLPTASSAQSLIAVEGKGVFSNRCAGCHEYPSEVGLTEADLARNAEGPPKRGPSLKGLIGRKAGSLEGYQYSDAMKAADVIWTEDTLRAFLLDPRSFVPGNKMVASGIKREDVLGPLIAYLLEVAKPATD